MGGTATVYFTAFGAFVDDDVAFFSVRLNSDGLHKPPALARSVSGIYVDMDRPKAERTMIPRGITERLHGLPAVSADESAVVF